MSAGVASLFAGLGQGVVDYVTQSHEADKQRDWLSKQYLADRNYKDPVNQVRRLRAAGVNPAMAMQNGMMDAGTSSPPPAYEQPKYDFSPISQSVDTAINYDLTKRQVESEARLKDENTLAQSYRNKFGLLDAYSDVMNKIADLKQKRADTSFLEKQAEYMQKQIRAYDERNQAEVNRINREANVAEKQAILIDLQSSYQKIVNQYLPAEKARGLRISDATIDKIYSAVRLNDANKAYSEANKALSEAQKHGVDLDNRTKDSIADALVDEAYNKAEESYWSSENIRMEAGRGEVGVGPFRGSIRSRSESARDVNHMRVRRDKNGRRYMYDNRINKRIYIQ